jgi:hypothetical protein
MTDSPSETDSPTETAVAEDEEIDRRRLIRWIAVLAFSVPVVVEVLTFGNIIGDQFLPGGQGTETGTATPTDHPNAVGVDDELLPETAATETIETSEVRTTESGRTYVLQVEVANETDSPVELRFRRLRLRDDSTVDGVSSTGTVQPGSSSPVTAAWSIPTGATPAAVQAVALRDGEAVVDEFVPLSRPPIVG